MRAVINTNVLLSGLLWHGAPHALIQCVRSGTLTLISSPALLAELADVVGRAKFDVILARASTPRERLLAEVRQLAQVMEPLPLPQPVSRDPDDDHALALAVAAGVDLIVTGDDDLLSIMMFHNIPIITAAEAVNRIAQSSRG